MHATQQAHGKRLLVINQYFAPDTAASGQVLASLCEGLAHRGFEIIVVCGFPSYTDDAPEAPPVEGRQEITVYRVGTGGVKGRSSIRKRIQGYLGFMLSAWKKIQVLSLREHFDAVVTLTNPPSVGLLGVLAQHKLHCPFVYVVHDLHPDILVKCGRLRSGLVVRLWDRMNSLIFTNATAIVVLGDRMREYLQVEKCVSNEKIRVIHNWSTQDISPRPRLNSFRTIHGLGDRFVVLYTGNMGISHNLEYLLEAAAKTQGDTQFLFVGSGEKKASLQATAKKLGLSNVIFLPYQPENVLNDMLAAADICVVALEPELTGLAVPSKTYPILAAGKPILAIGSSNNEVAEIVRQWDCGWVATTSDETHQLLQRLAASHDEVLRAGDNARKAYLENFTREKAVTRYVEMLKDVLQKGERTRKECC
ncbi:glycosyltransferase family 4 protein [Gelria sp. Kuro-4]|uniref:glycosyltransferase family 4 protein n=1 Tax=Gelria sp. Kuro-4 TaxID=2796927 RepID=UPI001C81FC31|nr:glycosyltransferase family 4 protein [Gelria sp. Kuro-4]